MTKKKWTRESYKIFCEEVKADLKQEGMDSDENAYDVAESLLCGEPELKDFIINVLGASDYRGRLASDI
jgi:hypothetical protein